MAALMLGALGVVYGDIGTSPLYAIQAVFLAKGHEVHVTQGDVYGVISLVFWTITFEVSVKYLTLVMRADDRGEGGIMALAGLLAGARLRRTALAAALVTLGILGASLFYGDGAITPAISVLSAVEGLKVAAPGVSSLVVPLSAGILAALFVIQRFGTGVVGRLFGPVMVLWFCALGAIGASEVAGHPAVLRALSPSYGAVFVVEHPEVAFIALASVVLAVTGAEALYADMGHFGRAPIRRAWFMLVFPALTLDYLAQGSLILRSPGATRNPFYLLLPGWAQIPMVVLATVATVIASQAVISGAFSVSQQAVQLGFLPRLTVRHTSEREIGQIYVPAIGVILLVAVLGIVFGFGSSTRLSSAYGVAVTGTFILTTVLFLAVARLLWRAPRTLIVLGVAVLGTIDVAFFAANLTKIVDGGWLPLAIAAAVFTVLTTWRAGREIVTRRRTQAEGPLRDFMEELRSRELTVGEVPGVAVFMNASTRTTPLALRANVERNNVLHERVLIVAVLTERVPHVPPSARVVAQERVLYSPATGDPMGRAAERITPLVLRFGFRDVPDVPAALRSACAHGQLEGGPDVEHATYFLSDITIVPTDAPGMAAWRKRLFVALARNAASPAQYFRLPDDRTVTLGARIPL